MDTVRPEGRLIRMTKRRPPHLRAGSARSREQLAALLPGVHAGRTATEQPGPHRGARGSHGSRRSSSCCSTPSSRRPTAGVMALYSELSEELEQTNRGVVALYRELDEKSEQLRLASESKNRFWANVSHELRTPLNSIIGADPAAGRPGGRARPRAAVPGGPDQEHHRHAAHPGQRPPRRRQGGVGAARHRPDRGQPARAARRAARARPADGRGQAGRGGGQRRRGARHRADRRDGADRYLA